MEFQKYLLMYFMWLKNLKIFNKRRTVNLTKIKTLYV